MLPRDTEKDLGDGSAEKPRGISNYSNNIHVAACRQPGTMPAEVEAAYGSQKGCQTHKFKLSALRDRAQSQGEAGAGPEGGCR